MKITNLRRDKGEGRIRISAAVQWEDCQRPAYELFFETEEHLSDYLTLNPDAFLVGCIIPALHYGERRVLVEGSVCPELIQNLKVAIDLLNFWFPSPQRSKSLVIEADRIESKPNRLNDRKSAFFFSGGIDSFATLRTNRLAFPKDHPMFIHDGLLVYGLEQDDPQLFKHVYKSLLAVAKLADIFFIPVYTNVYLVYRPEDKQNHFHLWEYEFGGAALAAVGHAFTNRTSNIYIANTWYLSHLDPWGSHPLLDPYFSSFNLKVIHDGFTQSRFQKTKLVAGWDAALKNLRVCNKYRLYNENYLNCGKCEKCLRTMLALTALKKYDKTDAFPVKHISQDYAKKHAKPSNDFQVGLYKEMVDPLIQAGRQDLSEAIRHNIELYYRRIKKRKLKQTVSSAFNKITGKH